MLTPASTQQAIKETADIHSHELMIYCPAADKAAFERKERRTEKQTEGRTTERALCTQISRRVSESAEIALSLFLAAKLG